MVTKKKNKKYDYKSVIIKASKALADDYSRMESYPSGEVAPIVNYNLIMNEILKDDEIRGYISKKTNKLTRSGYHWVGSDAEIKKAVKKAKQVHLNRHIKKMDFKGVSSGMIFIELIPNQSNTEVVDLRIHDEARIKPNLRRNGDVSSFSRREDDGTTTNFKNNKEMVVIKIDHIIDSFWTFPKISTLYNLIRIKQLIVEHIDMLFSTNQFKKHFHARNLNPKDVKSFINMISQGMVDRDKFLITVGAEEMQAQSIADPAELVHYIKMLDSISLKIMNILDVPPIVAGVTEGSNRSNSTSQTDVTFADAIMAFQRDFEDEFNSELLPLLGINAEFVRNPINKRSEKDIVEVATSLIANGADKAMLLEWMQREGMSLPNGLFDESIKKEKEDRQLATSGGIPQNSKSFPSRKPQEKDIQDFGDGKNINGTTKKTE